MPTFDLAYHTPIHSIWHMFWKYVRHLISISRAFLQSTWSIFAFPTKYWKTCAVRILRIKDTVAGKNSLLCEIVFGTFFAKFLSGIFRQCRCHKLRFSIWRVSWHSIWHMFSQFPLHKFHHFVWPVFFAFCLALSLTVWLACVLAFCLAFYSYRRPCIFVEGKKIF